MPPHATSFTTLITLMANVTNGDWIDGDHIFNVNLHIIHNNVLFIKKLFFIF